MTRRASKPLSREREVELASSIERSVHTLAETVTRSAAALRALQGLLEEASQDPCEATRLFLGLGEEWPVTAQTLGELLVAVRNLRARPTATGERERARAAVVLALCRARLSRQAIDGLVVELEARARRRRREQSAIAKTIATLRDCREVYERAKAALVAANMGLVFTMASKRAHPGLSLYDLVQEGSMGLMRAVDRFDHRRGLRFGTYAGWWIRHAINRALSDQARTIRVPVHVLEARFRVRRAAEQLSRNAGSEPTDAELAQRTGLPLDKVTMLASIPREPLSLDAPVFDEGDSQLSDVIPDRAGRSPIDCVAATQARVRLRRLLRTLTPREEEVIRLRFGIDRPEPLALEEVGQKFDVSRERIRQIESEALDKLHRHATTEKLDSLLSS